MRNERIASGMKSPFTGGAVIEVTDVEEQEFRKEKYMVHVRYYQCADTGEQFTTDDQDSLMCNDLYGQYRVMHGIPFPEEIKAIRVHYGLNYNQISRVLGFGINQYKEYEKGTVPSESNGKMIQMIRSKAGLITLLRSSQELFSPEEYARLYSTVSMASDYGEKNPLQWLFYGKTSRSVMNGFGEQNPDKLATMVKYFVCREGSICPTKLNKEMFYADFYHFRRYGVSISGLTYRAIQYGPVPEHFDTIYDNIEGLQKESIIQYEHETVRLTCKDGCVLMDITLSDVEKKTLELVASSLCHLSTSYLVEESHKEDAWIHYNDGHRFIPYTEAFSLRLIP